ncbi:DUF3325 domain-containing membrane protein [Aliarcobacter faecis]|uniref:DUF3325 family protein n=1 Tax=Aliarcobacter faecis TaxID=1564138 RepID=UPI00047B9254|nr:DUF3325 family protein [Aliarcobacter faecis]QKF74401.1 DUF3325 domain-containing membrane protein [Aliarcobacter faecis]
MMPNVSILWYGLVTILAIIGFLLLAITRKREGVVLLNRELQEKEKTIFKTLGSLFLIISFVFCIYLWKFSFGIVLYFGILTFAILFVIFPISYLAYKKARVKNIVPKSKEEIKDKVPFKKLYLLFMILIPLYAIYSLNNTPPKSVLRDDVIKDKIGEFEFVLAEHDSGEFEMADNGIAFMTFNIRFCEECDLKIDDVFITINKPFIQNNFGMPFGGNYWERIASVQIPFSLDEKSELYLTVVSRDKKVYQKTYNIKENFQTTFEEFEKYSKNAKLEIQW